MNLQPRPCQPYQKLAAQHLLLPPWSKYWCGKDTLVNSSGSPDSGETGRISSHPDHVQNRKNQGRKNSLCPLQGDRSSLEKPNPHCLLSNDSILVWCPLLTHDSDLFLRKKTRRGETKKTRNLGSGHLTLAMSYVKQVH